ncbi:MAG: class F sortase [Janibacter sp.]
MKRTKPPAWRVVALIAAVGLFFGAFAAASGSGPPAKTESPSSGADRSAAPAVHAPSGASSQPRSGVAPESVHIPSLEVDASLLDLGLTKGGQLEVPTMAQADRPGWYEHSSVPGETGPAVIAGHVDSQTGPAVFFELDTLQEDDTIRVDRSDGKTAVFAVTKVAAYDKDEFPTDAVYGSVAGQELRLITCGGDFEQDEGSYEQNVVVFAELRETVPTSS